MIVAVTGATGFVGRHVVRLLLARGHSVRVLARRESSLPDQTAAVTLVRGDLADHEALRTLMSGAEAVLHLVGIIVERGPATFEAVHVEGTRAVVEAARAARCLRIVHMSAVGVRDEPRATMYQRTKARAEAVVRASGLAAAVLRPAMIVGPENIPIRTLARLHRFFPLVPVFGSGDFPMQPVWVGDVALAFALAAERPHLVGEFELGGADRVTYADFVRAIGRASGHPRPLVRVPLGLVRAAARLCDALPALPPPITSDQLQMLVEGSATPANALTSVFGIEPLPLGEALRRSVG